MATFLYGQPSAPSTPQQAHFFFSSLNPHELFFCLFIFFACEATPCSLFLFEYSSLESAMFVPFSSPFLFR